MKKVSVAIILVIGFFAAYQFNIYSVQEKLGAKLAKNELENLSISINQSNYDKLLKQKDSILSNPRSHVWFRNPDEKKISVKARISDSKGKNKGKIKLAGHYIDHWKYETVSYKVKLKQGLCKGSKKFNLLNPGSRSYLTDWFAAKCAASLGLFTLNSELVLVKINNKDYVYLFEELFDAHLVNKFDINSGLIFNEVRDSENNIGLNFEDIKNTDPTLISKFENQYKNILSEEINILNSIDFKQMAKYYALADLFRSCHQLYTVNSRYVYNDSTKLFYPIGREYWLPQEPEVIPLLINKIKLDSVNLYGNIPRLLFESEKFTKLYFQELENVAKPSFLLNVENETRNQIETAKKIFWREINWGEKLVDIDLLKRNQHSILSELSKIDYAN